MNGRMTHLSLEFTSHIEQFSHALVFLINLL